MNETKNDSRILKSTPIKNEVLQSLIGSGLNGTELATALLIYRKTIGWNKPTDLISISQFSKSIPFSRRAICYALKKLALVKIIALVQKGKQNHLASKWSFNENIKSWQLVKKIALVQNRAATSAKNCARLVQKIAPTKETITKETKQKKDTDFEKFWLVFDKKKSRSKCETIWNSLNPDVKEKAITAAALYAASTPDKKFRKHPATWLNQGCWDDEIDTPSTDKSLKDEYAALGETKFREKYRLIYNEPKACALDVAGRKELKHMQITIKARNL